MRRRPHARAAWLALVITIALPGCSALVPFSSDRLDESDEATCSDGADNDGDGLVDDADPDCAPFSPTESSEAACSDGRDNDRDGLSDCNDPDCQRFRHCCTTARPLEVYPSLRGGSSTRPLTLGSSQMWRQVPEICAVDPALQIEPTRGLVFHSTACPERIELAARTFRLHAGMTLSFAIEPPRDVACRRLGVSLIPTSAVGADLLGQKCATTGCRDVPLPDFNLITVAATSHASDGDCATADQTHWLAQVDDDRYITQQEPRVRADWFEAGAGARSVELRYTSDGRWQVWAGATAQTRERRFESNPLRLDGLQVTLIIYGDADAEGAAIRDLQLSVQTGCRDSSRWQRAPEEPLFHKGAAPFTFHRNSSGTVGYPALCALAGCSVDRLLVAEGQTPQDRGVVWAMRRADSWVSMGPSAGFGLLDSQAGAKLGEPSIVASASKERRLDRACPGTLDSTAPVDCGWDVDAAFSTTEGTIVVGKLFASIRADTPQALCWREPPVVALRPGAFAASASAASWNAGQLATPALLVERRGDAPLYRLYYAAIGGAPPHGKWRIGLVESRDGETWHTPAALSDQESPGRLDGLLPGRDDVDLLDPSVWAAPGDDGRLTYHIWYVVRDLADGSTRVHHAVSEARDVAALGQRWVHDEAGAVLSPSAAPAYDSSGVRRPSVIFNAELRANVMFYTALDTHGAASIGRAVNLGIPLTPWW